MLDSLSTSDYRTINQRTEVRNLEPSDEAPEAQDDGGRGTISHLGLSLALALARHDLAAVEAAASQIRALVPTVTNEVDRGRLQGFVEVAADLLRFSNDVTGRIRLEPGSLAERMLLCIAAQNGVSNQDVLMKLGTDETRLSRAAARLQSLGLVVRRQAGRSVFWEASAAGAAVALAASTFEQRNAEEVRLSASDWMREFSLRLEADARQEDWIAVTDSLRESLSHTRGKTIEFDRIEVLGIGDGEKEVVRVVAEGAPGSTVAKLFVMKSST